MLDDLGQALYPDDRALSDAMLADAERSLEPDAFMAAVAAGQALTIEEGVEGAERTLARFATEDR